MVVALGAARGLNRQSSVLVEPALELADRNQSPATAADDAQLVHDVLLEEVDANAQGVSRLALREREPAELASDGSHVLLIDRRAVRRPCLYVARTT